MQSVVDEGAAPAAPAPEAPSSSSFEDTVLSLLAQLTADVAAQGERLEAVEQQQAPRFVDPRLDAPAQAGERSKRALEATPDGLPHSTTIPIFPNGQKVPEMVMRQYRPKFGSGDIVRLNPDAVPHGRADGRTRGELMAEKGVPDGYGEVFDRTFLSDTVGRGWKYRVRFDKAVMPGSNGGLTALYEWELQPA